jgi:hypothetical protein
VTDTAVRLHDRRRRPGDGRQHLDHGRRQVAAGTRLIRERSPLGVGRRQRTVDHQSPHVFDGEAGGELGGRVLAVMVEALLAADVAEDRLGDHHAVESPGSEHGSVGHGPIVCPARRGGQP